MNKMNTLAFVNFLLVKLFPTLIRQNFTPSKICAIQYVCMDVYTHMHTRARTHTHCAVMIVSHISAFGVVMMLSQCDIDNSKSEHHF